MDQVQNDLGIANRLLLALPQSTLRRIEPALEPIETKKGQVIDHVDRRIDYMYFVNRGLISIVKTMRDGRSVEVGSVGIEGVTDSSALFGMDEAVLETMVQIPGNGVSHEAREPDARARQGSEFSQAHAELFALCLRTDGANGGVQSLAFAGGALLPVAFDRP